MSEVFSFLCITSLMGFGVVGFLAVKLLSLPVVTNLIYLRVGGNVAGDLVEDVAKAVVAIKEPVMEAAIITVLNQYNLLPDKTTND